MAEPPDGPTPKRELVHAAARERSGQLVDQMVEEAGPPSPETYQRVLAQWFADD